MLFNTLVVLVPVLFVLLLGYVAGRAREFNADQASGINELLLDFALPCSLFVGIVGISRAELVHDLVFVLVVLAAMVGIYLIAYFFGRLVLHLQPGDSALFSLGAAFPAAPFFGPAVLGGLFGPGSAISNATVSIIANLFLVPGTVVILEVARAGRRDGASPSRTTIGVVILQGVKNAVKQPFVWAPVMGLLLVLIGVPVPALIDSILNLIGNATSGVALFAAGLTLAAHSVKLDRTVWLNAMLKSVGQPALMIVLVGLAGIHNPLATEGVVAMALPPGVIAPMLAARYGTYQSEAGSNLVLAALLMMVAVPAFAALVG